MKTPDNLRNLQGREYKPDYGACSKSVAGGLRDQWAQSGQVWQNPQTLHHRGSGVFMVAGKNIKLPSRMK
jgi:hypothetical protein